MNDLTHFTDPTPDLTDDERSLLRRAGASEEVIEMCDADLESIERKDGKQPTRNSVLQEVKKYLREWEKLTEDSVDEFTHMGGGFFRSVWNGDLYGAYSRADQNNSAILVEVFGVRRINDSRPSHRNPVTV